MAQGVGWAAVQDVRGPAMSFRPYLNDKHYGKFRLGSKANGPEWHRPDRVAIELDLAHLLGTYDRLAPCKALWVGLTAYRALPL